MTERRAAGFWAGWGRLLLLGALILGAVVLARQLGLGRSLSLDNVTRVRVWIEDFGSLGPLVFIAGSIVAVVAFLPGLPVTLLGGLVFGPLWGTVYVSVATTAGACLAFLIARYAARSTVEQWLARYPRLQHIDAVAARHGFRLVMITRLVPLFPFNLQNYAYGVTSIRFASYALTSWLCMLPATVALTFAGGALSEGTQGLRRTFFYLGAAGVLLVALSFLPRWLKGRSPVLEELMKAR